MRTSLLLLLLVVGTATLTAASWQLADVSDRQLLDKLRQQSPPTYCVNAAGKCFSTGQCCPGLVCAAFDDYFGQKPEVPGYCVKEKDLQVCAGSSDCAAGSKCASLGRTGERYCLPRPDNDDDADRQPQPPPLRPERPGRPAAAAISVIKGGLGSDCRADVDCQTEMKTADHRLCCQDVRRGRQGVKRICDRVTSISTCLP